MIVKTKKPELNSRFIFNDRTITAIKELSNSCASVLIWGVSEYIDIEMPFDELEEIFAESLQRDQFTDQPPVKSEKKEFPVIEVGKNKFQLNIVSTEREDVISHVLHLDVNFNLKNDPLKVLVECVIGVEDFCKYSSDRYSGSIYIGKLFDPEIVRNRVEQKIKEFLE